MYEWNKRHLYKRHLYMNYERRYLINQADTKFFISKRLQTYLDME